MDACDVPYDVLSAAEAMRRWPQFALAGRHDGAAPGAHRASCRRRRSTATTQRLAVAAGARLHAHSPVLGLRDLGDHYEVETAARRTAAAGWW